MEHYNKISAELEQFGFKRENDIFIFDIITYNNVVINGQQYQQPQHNYIYLQYIGEGYIIDVDCEESDSDIDITELSQFDVLNEKKEIITSICVRDINDIKFFLNLQ